MGLAIRGMIVLGRIGRVDILFAQLPSSPGQFRLKLGCPANFAISSITSFVISCSTPSSFSRPKYADKSIGGPIFTRTLAGINSGPIAVPS